jgi:hypothetical protein
VAAEQELLASWNDTAARQAIVDFVNTVTEEGGAGFVAPEARVTTFDNDGTLWAEKPMPIHHCANSSRTRQRTSGTLRGWAGRW